MTRDKNQLKKLHIRPNSLKPSWERRVQFNEGPQTKSSGSQLLSDDEIVDDDQQHATSDDVVPASNQDTTENVSGDVEENNNDSIENTSPVRITDDMATHMENFFAQAERTLQERHATSLRPTTRSAGGILKWSKQMNSNDVLVEDNSDE